MGAHAKDTGIRPRDRVKVLYIPPRPSAQSIENQINDALEELNYFSIESIQVMEQYIIIRYIG